ncbi:lipoprotein [Mesoplasma syrphidae]|uniref:lipoprotein n=1 Tax=Mesoplasma syrphidae TaxID=225999 RepID=UPI00047C7CDE|nr:lipoprotein [Mesoplasma syrphidae]
MKKLLTILGAVTLTATAGLSVVACGQKKDDAKLPPISNELIKEFQDELNKLWNDVYNQNAEKFVRKIGEEGDQENYQLFNLNYLNSQYEHIPGTRTFDLHEDKSNAEKFVYDLNKLFPKNQFADKIQKTLATGKNAVKYRNLYMGSPDSTLGDFKIAQDKPFNVIKTEYKENQEQEKLYSIEATVAKNMYHKDSEGQKSVFQTVEIPLNIIIGKDGVAITLVEKIARNLPKNLFSEKGSQFGTSRMKRSDANFKTYDDDLELGLSNQVNSNEFKNTIIKEIESINNNESQYNIKFGPKISEEKQISITSTMLRNDNKKQVETKRMFDLQRNPLANSLILKKADTKVLKEEDASVMLQEVIKDLDQNIDEHENDLNTFLDLYLDKNVNRESIVNKTYSFGNFRLNNVFINIEDNEVSLELPTMVIPWTYRNDSYSDLDKKDSWLVSLYNALNIVNKKVMAVNTNYFTERENVSRGMFAISKEALSEIRNSFSIEWNEILERTEKDKNSSYSKRVYNPKWPEIFKVRDNITWVDLARSGKNYITDECNFDFSSFSAKIETVLGIDKSLGEVGNHSTTGASLTSYGSKYPKENWRNQTSYAIGNGQTIVNASSSYIFNIGLINFRLFIPIDQGKGFDILSAATDDNWSGKQYFDLSNDRKLFSPTEAEFDWNASNPYVSDSYNWWSSINATFFQLR